jgi:hypothetical protein
MLRLDTLPFTTNLTCESCELRWANEEGHPLWPGKGGFFSYDAEKQIRILSGGADSRRLPNLPGGGFWGFYNTKWPNNSFYFPIYTKTFVSKFDKDGKPIQVAWNERIVLRVVHHFSHCIGIDFTEKFWMESKPDFSETKMNLLCHTVLSGANGDVNNVLSRVEVFVVEGDPDAAFVEQHSEQRYAEWMLTNAGSAS